MKIEEVIKQLESILAHVCSMAASPDADDIWKEDIAALEFAITALRSVSREQVEKVWRGKWELVRRMAASIECKCPKCQRTVIFTGKPANFCEKCGSANTDEAVQMVMERWKEAVVDEA